MNRQPQRCRRRRGPAQCRQRPAARSETDKVAPDSKTAVLLKAASRRGHRWRCKRVPAAPMSSPPPVP